MGSSSFYPKGSFILLAMTFFEAGAFAIFIVLNPTYWRESVGVSEKTANDANFLYGFLLNFTPLITAFIADNYWGRYAVLGMHSICFVIGFLFVSASTVVSLPYSAILGAVSLLLVSIAVGINKVILPTFNADQFQGHNEETRNKMFSWYYLAVNIGGIMSMLVVGNLKDFFSCFGGPCYLAVYGLSTGFVFISAALFIGFTRWFYRAPLTKNILVEAVKCIFVAFKNKKKIERKVSRQEKREVLDYALPEYGDKFIGNLKQALSVASLFFIGIPYWTCYQTMFSSWSRQYSFVDSRLGEITINFVMFIILDPITIVLSIFLQNNYIIPFLNKFIKITPLKKMALGGLFAALSFAFVMAVEQQIATDQLAPLGKGAQAAAWKQSSLSQECQLLLLKNETILPVPSVNDLKYLDLFPGIYETMLSCPFPQNVTKLQSITIQEGINFLALYPTKEGLKINLERLLYRRLEAMKTKVDLVSCRSIELTQKYFSTAGMEALDRAISLSNCQDSCELFVDLRGKSGARTVLFDDYDCSMERSNNTANGFTEIVAIPGYTVKGIFMWPQNIAFGLSESLLAVGALEFAYTQTATSMKAFMQALWLLTAAMGNILGFLLNQVGMSPFTGHIVYGGIMFFFTLIFIVSTSKYNYVEIEEEISNEQ